MTNELLSIKLLELEALVESCEDHSLVESHARELLHHITMNDEEFDASGNASIQVMLTLARSLWQCGLPQNALPWAEEALSIALKEGMKEMQATILGNIGLLYTDLSESTLALEYYDRALSLATELGNKNGMATTIGNIGLVYMELAEYSRALEYYRRALALSEELDSKSGMATRNANIGMVYMEFADYPRALEYLQKSLALDEELHNRHSIAATLHNIGVILQRMSNYPKALEKFHQALAINEAIGNNQWKANNLSSIGNVYLALADYERALEYFERALALSEVFGRQGDKAHIIGSIGNVYLNQKDYPRALEYFRQALTLVEMIGSKSGIELYISNIGNVYLQLADYSAALEHFTMALALSEELENVRGLATNFGSIGLLYSKEDYEHHDTDRAKEYLLKALSMFEEIGERKEQYETHHYLANLFEKEKNWEKFALHYKKFHDLKDEVQSDEAKQQADRLDFERKSAETEKLHAVERAKHEATEQLLHNVLPPSIAAKMLTGSKLIAEKIPSVSVLFADIVNFTALSQRITPEELVDGLDRIFSTFDALAEKHGLEKIKTIGDAYMVVSGAPLPRPDHAEAMAHFALEMMVAMKEFRSISTGEEIQLRIGIHSGEVVAGVIGKKKFAYDLWGDAVNTASRMESHGEEDKIHVSEEFKHAVETQNFASLQFIERGEMHIKGKGMMRTYYLDKAHT
ncbi:MAG: tetratricopeptide repeat protein [Ignavibacteria bacterium]|nr:tetratricopeptide repeat protein [Ignavibacteria bacterium]